MRLVCCPGDADRARSLPIRDAVEKRLPEVIPTTRSAVVGSCRRTAALLPEDVMPRRTAALALIVATAWTLTSTAGAAPGDYAGPPPVGVPAPSAHTGPPAPPPPTDTGVLPPPGTPPAVPVSDYTGVGPSYVGGFPPPGAMEATDAFAAIARPDGGSRPPADLAAADDGGVSRVPVTRSDVVGLSIIAALVVASLVSLRRRAA